MNFHDRQSSRKMNLNFLVNADIRHSIPDHKFLMEALSNRMNIPGWQACSIKIQE